MLKGNIYRPYVLSDCFTVRPLQTNGISLSPKMCRREHVCRHQSRHIQTKGQERILAKIVWVRSIKNDVRFGC